MVLQRPQIGKYISAEQAPRKFGQKTCVYRIYNHENKITIGEVKWFGAWRKYAFFPAAESVFEQQCLADITTFLEALMNHRKEQRDRLKRIAEMRESIAEGS